MKIAVLSAILGNFDTPVDPPQQDIPFTFHRFTDKDFPPIAQWDPRLQYRIPKTHGWQMLPGYDAYVWLDGAMTLARPDSLSWLLGQMSIAEMLFFQHPYRATVRQEVEHIDEHLRAGKPYISARYKNGLHWDQLMLMDGDEPLYASTVFAYRNSPKVQEFLKDWWYYGSRYYTCDQVNLSYIIKKHKILHKVIHQNQYKCQYLKEASKHR